MATRKGKCTNFGECEKANNSEIIEIPLGQEFVCPNGCGELIEIPQRRIKPISLIVGTSGVIFILVAVIFLYPYLTSETENCNVSPQFSYKDEIVNSFKNGQFNEKLKELKNSLGKDEELDQLWKVIQKPINFVTKLQYKKSGQPLSDAIDIDSHKLQDLTLTHDDIYRLLVSFDHPKIFLYIFQKDQYGDIMRIFPELVWSKMENPIEPGLENYEIPGKGEYFFLNELKNPDSGPIEEILYIVASPWEANDLKKLYGEVKAATKIEERNSKIDELFKKMEKRENLNLKCVYYKKISFLHAHSE